LCCSGACLAQFVCGESCREGQERFDGFAECPRCNAAGVSVAQLEIQDGSIVSFGLKAQSRCEIEASQGPQSNQVVLLPSLDFCGRTERLRSQVDAAFEYRSRAVIGIANGSYAGDAEHPFVHAPVVGHVGELTLALVKAVVFAAIVAIVSCHKGLDTHGGPAGVANSVNAAVVESTLLLMLVNVAITQLYVLIFPRVTL